MESEVFSPLPEAPKGQRNFGKNSPQIAVIETAWRFYGVDLGGVPGISAGLLCMLISEVGTREQLLAAFPTPERFVSWMRLCTDNRISGGKLLKAKTRKVVSAVWRVRSDSACSDYSNHKARWEAMCAGWRVSLAKRKEPPPLRTIWRVSSME